MRIGQQEPKRGNPTLLAVLIAASLILVTVYFREGDGGPVHGVRRAALAASAPVSALGDWITGPFRGAVSFVSDITVSRERLTTLEAQNEQLRARLAELEEARQENERLRELVSFAEERRFTTLGARVIQRPVGTWEGVIVLDRGSADGVEPGMPVIAAQGLVGQVIEVAEHVAKVRLVNDQRGGVAAMVQSTRALGVVRGSIDGRLSLDFVDRAQIPVVGDVVITSGLGGVYPKGIVIGDVTEIDDRRGELYPRIAVQSRVPLGTMEDVLVLVGPVLDTESGEIE